MAYKFVPYTQPGAGGSAVLTELVVTENGVYDEPMIGGGLEPITWDGNTDGKVTIRPSGTFVFAKISDKVFSVDDYIGSTLTISDMSPMTVTSDSIMADDTYVNANGFVISILVPNAVVDGVVFPEVGTYVANMGGYCFISLTFAGGTPVPADGWNKVTVNVTGDIIDVDELPTENIEDGKIYRVTKESEESVNVYVYDGTTASILEDFVESTSFAQQGYIRGVYQIVDALPEMEGDVADLENRTIPVYVVRATGEPFVYMTAFGGWVSETEMATQMFVDSGYSHMASYTFNGLVSNTDEMTEPGYYTLITPAESYTIYGIPNNAPVKRLVDGAWVDLA